MAYYSFHQFRHLFGTKQNTMKTKFIIENKQTGGLTYAESADSAAFHIWGSEGHRVYGLTEITDLPASVDAIKRGLAVVAPSLSFDRLDCVAQTKPAPLTIERTVTVNGCPKVFTLGLVDKVDLKGKYYTVRESLTGRRVYNALDKPLLKLFEVNTGRELLYSDLIISDWTDFSTLPPEPPVASVATGKVQVYEQNSATVQQVAPQETASAESKANAFLAAARRLADVYNVGIEFAAQILQTHS